MLPGKSKDVLEKNPPKQGLKRNQTSDSRTIATVLEKNPPKQGLKHTKLLHFQILSSRFREKSTKTRIETFLEK